MQNTITTVVEPMVSALVGNDTFFNSARTSARNNFMDSVIRLNIEPSVSLTHQPAPPQTVTTTFLSMLSVAGALGFEPRPSVLETEVLPLTPCPYRIRIAGTTPASAYFTSLWAICFRQNLQNLLRYNRSGSFFLFLLVE